MQENEILVITRRKQSGGHVLLKVTYFQVSFIEVEHIYAHGLSYLR